MLETALELLIIAEHHIEYLFVLALPVDEPLEPLARHLDFMPSALAALSPDFLVAL